MASHCASLNFEDADPWQKKAPAAAAGGGADAGQSALAYLHDAQDQGSNFFGSSDETSEKEEATKEPILTFHDDTLSKIAPGKGTHNFEENVTFALAAVVEAQRDIQEAIEQAGTGDAGQWSSKHGASASDHQSQRQHELQQLTSSILGK